MLRLAGKKNQHAAFWNILLIFPEKKIWQFMHIVKMYVKQ